MMPFGRRTASLSSPSLPIPLKPLPVLSLSPPTLFTILSQFRLFRVLRFPSLSLSFSLINSQIKEERTDGERSPKGG